MGTVPEPMAGFETLPVDMAVGWLAVLDRLNPHKRGLLVVLLFDGGVANSQSRIGQTPQRLCFAVD
jgi:hypothetical protein